MFCHVIQSEILLKKHFKDNLRKRSLFLRFVVARLLTIANKIIMQGAYIVVMVRLT